MARVAEYVAAEAIRSQPKVMTNGRRPISGRKQMLRPRGVKLEEVATDATRGCGEEVGKLSRTREVAKRLPNAPLADQVFQVLRGSHKLGTRGR